MAKLITSFNTSQKLEWQALSVYNQKAETESQIYYYLIHQATTKPSAYCNLLLSVCFTLTSQQQVTLIHKR